MKLQRKLLTLGDAYNAIEATTKGAFDICAHDVVYRRKSLSILPSNEKPFDYTRWLLRIDQARKGGELWLYPKKASDWFLFIGVIYVPDFPTLSMASVYAMPEKTKRPPEAVEWQKKIRSAFKKAKQAQLNTV